MYIELQGTIVGKGEEDVVLSLLRHHVGDRGVMLIVRGHHLNLFIVAQYSLARAIDILYLKKLFSKYLNLCDYIFIMQYDIYYLPKS